LFLGVSTG